MRKKERVAVNLSSLCSSSRTDSIETEEISSFQDLQTSSSFSLRAGGRTNDAKGRVSFDQNVSDLFFFFSFPGKPASPFPQNDSLSQLSLPRQPHPGILRRTLLHPLRTNEETSNTPPRRVSLPPLVFLACKEVQRRTSEPRMLRRVSSSFLSFLTSPTRDFKRSFVQSARDTLY